ncbi:Argininosuccinate lyase 1 [Hydrogenophaga sp. T4]|nr:Argininosuccinate lyase 1 [Hydrogenophaga sp. T4]
MAVTLGMVDEQGHPQVCQNSLDGVSDRDFAIEFTAAASLCMVHISRFSEELILWMSQNFGFVKIADRFTTGSSIMPQKKNPDVPELARGKTGRVVGHLMGLITLMKGQPLATTRTTRKTRSRCSTPWTRSRTPCASSPRWWVASSTRPRGRRKVASPSTPSPWKKPPRRATPPPPTWPTTW